MAGKDGDLDFEARLNLLRAKLPLTAAQILDTASISLKKVRTVYRVCSQHWLGDKKLLLRLRCKNILRVTSSEHVSGESDEI